MAHDTSDPSVGISYDGGWPVFRLSHLPDDYDHAHLVRVAKRIQMVVRDPAGWTLSVRGRDQGTIFPDWGEALEAAREKKTRKVLIHPVWTGPGKPLPEYDDED